MKWLLPLALSFGLISIAHAQINQLPNAQTPLTGNEFIAVDQPQGTNFKTVKALISSISQIGTDRQIISVTGSSTLPQGFTGVVLASGGVAITLPPTPSLGQVLTIKDYNGTASTNFITIIGNSGATIEGQSQLVISLNYGWAHLIYSGTKWVQI